MNYEIPKWAKKFFHLFKKLLISFINEPFVKITCTVIAGLLGWWLGVQYQDKNWKEQYSLSILESDRKQAETIFNEISRLMDDRYYKTIRLLSAYKQNDSVRILECRKSLSLQLEEWNANRHRNNSLIEAYFGIRITNYYINNIQKPFANSGNYIMYRGAKTHEEQQQLSRMLDSIEANIIIFNRMMLTSIQQNKIGRFCSGKI